MRITSWVSRSSPSYRALVAAMATGLVESELGFAGIQNFPTVGLWEVEMRRRLEETAMGYGLKLSVSHSRARWAAHKRRLTLPCVALALRAPYRLALPGCAPHSA